MEVASRSHQHSLGPYRVKQALHVSTLDSDDEREKEKQKEKAKKDAVKKVGYTLGTVAPKPELTGVFINEYCSQIMCV